LRLKLFDAQGRPLRAEFVALKATLPARELGPLDVVLTERATGWVGDFTFPFSGEWRLALEVEKEDVSAITTGGTLDIA
jgi:hypothetical protein